MLSFHTFQLRRQASVPLRLIVSLSKKTDTKRQAECVSKWLRNIKTTVLDEKGVSHFCDTPHPPSYGSLINAQ